VSAQLDTIKQASQCAAHVIPAVRLALEAALPSTAPAVIQDMYCSLLPACQLLPVPTTTLTGSVSTPAPTIHIRQLMSVLNAPTTAIHVLVPLFALPVKQDTCFNQATALVILRALYYSIKSTVSATTVPLLVNLA